LSKQRDDERLKLAKFTQSQDGSSIGLSKGVGSASVAASEVPSYLEQRKRKIDDRDDAIKLAELQQVCPWIPQFTPQADASGQKAPPPKRPSSPFSGLPLRAKDLIPVNLVKESNESNQQSTVRYMCSLTR
jgi:hypothetical protein